MQTKWNSGPNVRNRRLADCVFSVWDDRFGLTLYVNHFQPGQCREVFRHNAGDHDQIERVDFPTDNLGKRPTAATVTAYARAAFVTYSRIHGKKTA